MNCCKNDMRLYAITDRTWLNGETLCSQVEKALVGGATFIQIREKNLEKDKIVEEAGQLKKLCKKYNVPFVINDNVEIAKLTDADGVHVGQGDITAADARSILGKDKIIGVSAKTVEQALLAQKMGADYIGTGAVFPTSSKSDAKVCGISSLKAVCDAVDIPVVAIGGINENNILDLKGSGADGIAVISAIFAQNDIISATKKLKKLVMEMVKND